jgi:hypothetical protein
MAKAEWRWRPTLRWWWWWRWNSKMKTKNWRKNSIRVGHDDSPDHIVNTCAYTCACLLITDDVVVNSQSEESKIPQWMYWFDDVVVNSQSEESKIPQWMYWFGKKNSPAGDANQTPPPWFGEMCCSFLYTLDPCRNTKMTLLMSCKRATFMYTYIRQYAWSSPAWAFSIRKGLLSLLSLKYMYPLMVAIAGTDMRGILILDGPCSDWYDPKCPSKHNGT